VNGVVFNVTVKRSARNGTTHQPSTWSYRGGGGEARMRRTVCSATTTQPSQVLAAELMGAYNDVRAASGRKHTTMRRLQTPDAWCTTWPRRPIY